MAARDPAQRALVARLAAYSRWSRCDDPLAATETSRKSFLDRFDRQVDPENKLPVDERRRRADAALKAHMTRIALRSAQARKRRGKGTAA